jgi:hypothetical protein
MRAGTCHFETPSAVELTSHSSTFEVGYSVTRFDTDRTENQYAMYVAA